MENKYTKKASAKIYKAVAKIDPSMSKNISLNQAFDILMENWNLECEIEGALDNVSTAKIFRDEELVQTYTFKDNITRQAAGVDFNWDVIFKTILEDILKTKIYKRPKKKRAYHKKVEESIDNRAKSAKISSQTIKANKSVIKTEPPKKHALNKK